MVSGKPVIKGTRIPVHLTLEPSDPPLKVVVLEEGIVICRRGEAFGKSWALM
ncbi:MAG: hypothetical protein QXR65_09050 [Candidatus Bathyarchaeia archaeon]